MRPAVILGAGAAAVLVAAVIGIRLTSSPSAPPGLDALLANLPPGVTASHGAVSFNPLAGTADLHQVVIQKLGQTVFAADEVKVTGIEGLSLTGAPSMIGHATLTNAAFGGAQVSKIELDHLAAETLRQILAPDAYTNGKPVWGDQRPVLGSLELWDLRAHADAPPKQKGKVHITGTDLAVAHARITKLTARQLQAPLSAEAVKDPGFASDALRAFSEGDSGFEQLRLTLHGAGELTLARGQSKGYAAGRIGSEEIDDIAFTAEDNLGAAHLHLVAMKGLDIAHLIDQLPAVIAAQQAHLPTPSLSGGVKLNDFVLSGFDADFHTAPRVTLDSLTEHIDHNGDLDSTTAQMKNLAVTFTGRDVAANVSAALQDFGMQDFTVDLDGASTADLQGGKVTLTKDDMQFHGLGTLHMSFALENYFPGTGPRADVMSRLRQARLVHGAIGWDDASLTGRLFKIAATKSGHTEAELKANIEVGLAMLPRFLPNQPDAADQIKAFLDGQHSINITMEPTAPVSLGDVGGAQPQDKAGLLGLKISGN